MKYLLMSLTIGFLLLTCGEEEKTSLPSCSEIDGFNICSDTTYLNYDGFLTRLTSVDENKIYSVLHKEIEREYENEFERYLLIFNSAGNIISKTKFPERFEQQFYYDLKIQNDSLILIDYQHETPYFFNEKFNKWDPLKNFVPTIYEDENYKLTSVCYGEFGGLIYFHEKNSDKIFQADATCFKSINKLKETYFVTNYLAHGLGQSNVVSVTNPKGLISSGLPLQKQSDFNPKSIRSYKGVEILLDTFELEIKYSFVYNDTLYLTFAKGKSISFGTIKSGKIQEVTFPLDFANTYYQQQIEGNNSVCNFYSTKLELPGLVFWSNDRIMLRYIKKK